MRYCWGWLVACSLLAGCGPAPEPRPDTGARACVLAYYRAIIAREWSAAYTLLDRDSQQEWSLARFRQAAERYRERLGFEPEAVRVVSCDEQGARALAHVQVLGRADARQKRFRDALTLRQAEGGWHVVLPREFGKARK